MYLFESSLYLVKYKKKLESYIEYKLYHCHRVYVEWVFQYIVPSSANPEKKQMNMVVLKWVLVSFNW